MKIFLQRKVDSTSMTPNLGEVPFQLHYEKDRQTARNPQHGWPGIQVRTLES